MIWLPPSLKTKRGLDASEDLQFPTKKGWTLIKASSVLEHPWFGISVCYHLFWELCALWFWSLWPKQNLTLQSSSSWNLHFAFLLRCHAAVEIHIKWKNTWFEVGLSYCGVFMWKWSLEIQRWTRLKICYCWAAFSFINSSHKYFLTFIYFKKDGKPNIPGK